MTSKGDLAKGDLEIDPRGLIFEAYRMNIGPEDCRTIFFDWALGQPDSVDAEHLRILLDRYGRSQPDHPMTAVLVEGFDRTSGLSHRRGGWRARREKGNTPKA